MRELALHLPSGKVFLSPVDAISFLPQVTFQ
jgi:hypothetical protein